MKKSFFLAAALVAATAAAAQSGQFEPSKSQPVATQGFAPESRFIDRVWFSVVYTPKFMLSESDSDRPFDDYKKTIHNYAFEAGYMFTPRLSLGLGAAYERDWTKAGGAIDMVPLYLHANYFYGKRRGGLFNYARLGALISADDAAKTGFTGGAGVGYRLMLRGRFGMDFKAGYDYSGARVNTALFDHQGFQGRGWSRHSLSLGVGLVF